MKLFSARLLPIPSLLRRGLAGAATLLPGLALANPTGGQVVSGQVTITTPNSNGMVVTEGSNSAIVNWQSFSIGGNQYVQFIQPSSSSVILNRVVGNSPSSIFGSMTGNGRVFLINPDGVLFAPGSSVDVGALVASTVNISNSDFLAGHYVFTGGTSGAGVTNNGSITAHQGGFVVLNGDYVHNTGVIQAKLGEVVLASGSAMTMTLDQGGLIGYSVNKAALSKQAGVANSGQLLADGGHIIMTAEVAHNLVGTAINNTGLVRAQGISQHNGIIELTASGGDIDNSGTLDASSQSGNGGSLQLHSDYNIDLQSGTLLDASGAELGGNIQVVAGGAMHLRAGALIEGIASKKGGRGGTAELSAHGKFSVAGDVKLGEGGSLTIDPTNVTIANGSGTSSSATYFQQSLQSTLAAGTSVTIIASNSITLDALSSGVLDGRGTGANAGGGGSLTLDINGPSGTIQFQNTGNSIDVDGDLNLSAGSTGGIINVGNLSAGNIDLIGKTSVTTGSLHAHFGSLTLTGGNVSTGSIDVQNTNLGESSLSINSTGNVSVNGPITVAGGGGHGTSDSGFGNNLMADAQILATGNVTVSGNIAVTGRAFTQSSHDGSFSRIVSAGSADLSIQGNKVSLGGVSVTAVGSASFVAKANQSITISSDVDVSATRAIFSTTQASGSNSFDNTGEASIRLQSINSGGAAGLSITTNGLTATGPYAGVSVTGGTLNLKNGSSGKAIVATAFTGGTSTSGSGAYYQHSYGGGNGFVATDFDAAGVVIDRVGSGTTKIGGISVSGPAASLQLLGSGGVTTISGGISVQASGYTLTGSASQFSGFHVPGSPIGHGRGINSSAAILAPPVILDGTTHWGTARFVAGGSSSGAGDTLNISGGVTVAGLGQAYININAAALTIGGAVSVTASKGSLQGIATSGYFGTDSQFLGSITRSISNSAGTGAATFGQANVTVNIDSTSGDASLGSLKVRGLSAQASFQGGRNITITGATSIDGEFGGVAPDFKEVMTLAKNGGGSSTGTTEWVGDNNFLKMGGVIDPTGTVSLGDVSVSGFGFVNLTVHGNSVTMGNVSLTQGTGLFTSTDFTRYSSSYAVTNPGTLIDLHATSGPVQATSLTVNSAGALTQAVELDVANTYSITAPSYSSVVSGVSTLIHPLLFPAPTSTDDVIAVPANLVFSGISVSATDIALNISGNLALTSEALAASKTLTIQTGGSLTLASNTLAAGSSMTVGANGNLTLAGNIMSAGKSLSLNAGSNFSDSGSSLISPSVTIDATGTLALNNTSISGSANGGRGDISLTGSQIGLNSGQSLTGRNISLDVTGGNLSLSSNTLDASAALTLAASGTISATSAVLLGDTTTLTAPNGITITDSMVAGSGGSAPSTSITMTASNGIITGTGSTLIEGVTVDLTAGGLVSNTNESTPRISATYLTLDATDSTLTLGPSVVLDVSQDLHLISQTGGIVITQNLSAGADVTIQADAGNVSAQAIDAGGSLAISATGSITLSQDAQTGGAIVMTAGNAGVNTQNLTAGSSVTVTTSGAVNVGNLQVGLGSAGAGSGTALSLSGTRITTGNIVNETPTGTFGDDNDMNLIATAGGITTGNITTAVAGSTTAFLTMTATGGGIKTGNISVEGLGLTASGNVGLGSLVLQSPTPPQTTITSSGGTVTLASLDGNGPATISGHGDVQITGATTLTGDLAITSTAGSITTGALTVAGLQMSARSNAGLGSVDVTASTGNDQITSSNGTVTLAGLSGNGAMTLSGAGAVQITGATTITGNLAITSSGGNIQTADITGANSIDFDAAGSIATGNLSTSSDLTLTAGTGITLTNAVLAAGGKLLLSAGSGDLTATNDTFLGTGISLTSTTGSIVLNNSLLSAGSIDATAGGALSISHSSLGGVATDPTNTTIALSAGTDLTIDTATAMVGNTISLNAAGSIAVNDAVFSGGSIAAVAGSGLSISGSTLSGLSTSSNGAATTIALTANGGDLTLAGNTTLAGATVGLNASGSIAVNDSQLSGGSIAAVAGNGLSLDNATVAGLASSSGGTATTIALTANNGDLALDGSTTLNGDAIGLFASGSITSASSSSGSTTISAGALSAQAFNSIDLTHALLEIGTDTAQFGVDSALLQQISQQSGGKIPLPGSGPNAAFKAQTVDLGTIQTQHAGDDLYLYIESQATSTGLGYSIANIVGAGDALLDYNLFGGNTQVVNVPPGRLPLTALAGTTTPATLTIDGTVNAPAGLTTLVIGSSVQNAGITINADAVFSPNDPASVNLVFATTGDVSGTSNLHTTGYVFILNQISSPVNSLPIQPGDYTPPPTGTLGSPQPSPGDPDDSGVNDANKGTIVQQTSTQSALTSCGGT